MPQPPNASPRAHIPDPARPAGGCTCLERSGRGPAGNRSDRHAEMRPKHADADREARMTQMLLALDMPPDDVRGLVAADDSVVVHRYIELHSERLAERLADQLRALVRVEHTLVQTILPRRSASPSARSASDEVPDGTK